MTTKNEIISQCLTLVNQIVENKLKVYMNLQIGVEVSFVFDNMDKNKVSPSQKQRSIDRAIKFKQKIEEKDANEIGDTVKKKSEIKNEVKIEIAKETDDKTAAVENETKEIICESIMLDRPTVFENDKKVENDLTKHLEAKSIGVEKVIFKRDASRDLKMIEIRIRPITKKKIEEANIEFRDCRILWMR